MIKLIADGYDVSKLVSSVVWRGDIDDAARYIDVVLPAVIEPQLGDKVEFSWEDSMLFEGSVIEYFCDNKTVNMTCADKGYHLQKSLTFKQYSGTPQSIASQVCSEFEVPIGVLEKRTDSVFVVSLGEFTPYEVICRAYNGTTGKHGYRTWMKDGKLNVKQVSESPVCNLELDIERVDYTASLEGMVNSVVILNNKGKKIGQVQNEEDKNKYGLFQSVYRAVSTRDENYEAKQRLAGISKQGSVYAVGDVLAVTGSVVGIMSKNTIVKGNFVVLSDAHTFTGLGHMMELKFS